MNTLKKIGAGAAILVGLTGATVFIFGDEEPLPEDRMSYIFLEKDGSYEGALCRNCLVTPESGRILIEVTEEQAELLSLGYDAQLVVDQLVITKGERAIELENQEIEDFNDRIYKQIAEVEEIRKGKEVVGDDYTKELQKINELQLKLK